MSSGISIRSPVFSVFKTYIKIIKNFLAEHKYEAIITILAAAGAGFGIYFILIDELRDTAKFVKIISITLVPSYFGMYLANHCSVDDKELQKNYLRPREILYVQFLRSFIILGLFQVMVWPALYMTGLLDEVYFLTMFCVNGVAAVALSFRGVFSGHYSTGVGETKASFFINKKSSVFKTLVSLWLSSLYRQELLRVGYTTGLLMIGYYCAMYVPRDQENIFHILFLLIYPLIFCVSNLDLHRETFLRLNHYLPNRRSMFFVDTSIWFGFMALHFCIYLWALQIKNFPVTSMAWFILLSLFGIFYIQLVKFIMMRQKLMRGLFLGFSLAIPFLVPIFFVYSMRRLTHGRI